MTACHHGRVVPDDEDAQSLTKVTHHLALVLAKVNLDNLALSQNFPKMMILQHYFFYIAQLNHFNGWCQNLQCQIVWVNCPFCYVDAKLSGLLCWYHCQIGPF